MPICRPLLHIPYTTLALAVLSLAAPAMAEENSETEVVSWGAAGKDQVGTSFAVFGHLGFGTRLNDSPYGEPFEPSGPLFGISGFVKPVWRFSVGLGYEHLNFGQDRKDEGSTVFKEVERDLNTLWALGRFYPVRNENIALYLGLGGGVTWQRLDASFATAAVNPNVNLNPQVCSANDSGAFGFRGGIGIEAPIAGGVGVMAELGFDRYQLSSAELDGCALGAGNATLFGLRLGVDVGFERKRKPMPEQAPPPPPPDRDGDGIADASDACPDAPGYAHPDPAKNGCPPPKDTDLDGIADDYDACPTVVGVANPDPAKNGCPPPKDTDGDTVTDDADACVDIPGLRTNDPATNGCPGDTDGDGFRDDKDGCPTEKGIANEDPKKNGCPAVQVTKAEIVINEQVQFDFDLATIKEVSFPLLDQVAQTLKEHPEILKVEVQGHTDNQGKPEHNKTLSQNRAQAVRKALVKRGVDFLRLEAKGYGQDVPIADNESEEGRKKNRRVQFKILQQKEPGAPGDKPAAPPAATTVKPADKKPAIPLPSPKKPADAKPAEKKP